METHIEFIIDIINNSTGSEYEYKPKYTEEELSVYFLAKLGAHGIAVRIDWDENGEEYYYLQDLEA